MQNKTDRIYFSGLNGLRFFAALSVIITHIELLKTSFGFKSYWKNPVIFNLGGIGVCFFFVLSGFLITYLLLVEKQKYKSIKVKEFYIRRILRIWPLYYFILILGFFILPVFDIIHIPYLQESFKENFFENLVLYLMILPNVAFAIFPAVPHIGQAWSIGVEEQFYIIWPWVISKSKNVLKTLITIIISLFLIKFCILILGEFYSESDWYNPLKLFIAMAKFECMAIGGIGAYFLFTNNKLLSLLQNRYATLSSIILIPILIYITPENLQDGVHIIYSVLFLIIILNIITFLYFENKIFNYLGKISYGIYMYHFMIIPLVLSMFQKYISVDSEVITNLGIYSLTILTTIFVSGLSYKYFEKPFIDLKTRFTTIKSGDQP